MKNKRNNEASPLESLVVFTKSDWDFHQSLIKNLIKMERYKQYEEDLVAVFDLFRLLAIKRFPNIRFGWELEAACDIEGLRQLAHELDDLPTPEALRRKLAELAGKEN